VQEGSPCGARLVDDLLGKYLVIIAVVGLFISNNIGFKPGTSPPPVNIAKIPFLSLIFAIEYPPPK
jgi:hypothetical protein